MALGKRIESFKKKKKVMGQIVYPTVTNRNLINGIGIRISWKLSDLKIKKKAMTEQWRKQKVNQHKCIKG